mgnify:CR=1 FL=1
MNVILPACRVRMSCASMASSSVTRGSTLSWCRWPLMINVIGTAMFAAVVPGPCATTPARRRT